MNLTILSLIALLAGLYLIFQALDGAVVRRRGEIAILRSLGITETIIQWHWLVEALVLGVCGGIVGSMLGWATAQLAVRSIAMVVSALYYTTTVDSAHLDFQEFLLAMILSIGSALFTGWWPARQAAAIPPAQILSLETDKNALRSPLQSIKIGALFLLLSGLLCLAPAATFLRGVHLPLGGYVATLLLILAGGIFCGYFTEYLSSLLSYFGKSSLAVKLASSHLRPLSKRHHLAASGILSGLTMAAGMLIMIASFEQTMQRWIATAFQADLYISNADYQGSSLGHQLSQPLLEEITHDRRVADVEAIGSRHLTLDHLETTLNGIDVTFLKNHQNILWKDGPLNEDFFDENKNSHLLLASESFSERFRLHRGDHLILPTPSGNQEMTIVGIFSDYGNERGSLSLDRRYLARYFHDDAATVLIVILKAGVDPEAMQLQLSSQFPGLSILSNRHLREEILRIFHQTFSITYALELIGIVVAIVGLGMTLSNILIDRKRELTTLRALGCSYQTIALATALEGGLLAIGGAVIGTLVSLGIGYILIYVINRQSFGWTLQFAIPYFPLALLGVAVVLSGSLVSYLVGYTNSNLQADLHE
jgi:putative ABC transport system permease protein